MPVGLEITWRISTFKFKFFKPFSLFFFEIPIQNDLKYSDNLQDVEKKTFKDYNLHISSS